MAEQNGIFMANFETLFLYIFFSKLSMYLLPKVNTFFAQSRIIISSIMWLVESIKLLSDVRRYKLVSIIDVLQFIVLFYLKRNSERSEKKLFEPNLKIELQKPFITDAHIHI